MTAAEPPTPSDDLPEVHSAGRGDVWFAVVSMSERAADGDDDGYLRWHLLDHLPEQYRIDGLRNGTRWFSTPACRAARAVSEPPYDRVDHVVAYLFGAPDGVETALDTFFGLGASLHRAGRMPLSPAPGGGGRLGAGVEGGVTAGAGGRRCPAVAATPRRLSRRSRRPTARAMPFPTHPVWTRLVEAPGVAGIWRFGDGAALNPRLDNGDARHLAVCYLDDDPATVAPAIGERAEGAMVRPQRASVARGAVRGRRAQVIHAIDEAPAQRGRGADLGPGERQERRAMRPILRGRLTVPPAPGMRPSEISGSAILVS